MNVQDDTDAKVKKMAEDVAQVKMANMVESTASRAECISALKDTSVAIEDFKRDIDSHASLGLTPLEETYFTHLDSQLRKTVGKFLMQTDSEFEEVASQLRPTTSPADISAAADPPADPEDDPKDGRVSLIDGVRPPTAITLRDQIHFERHGVRPERRRRSGRVARSPTGPEPSKGFS